ncbi:MAG: hypothetical protein M3P23_15620 [Actinomycetota bacterium]|nr:hypothetical protein [Actinomycetota bacterium]
MGSDPAKSFVPTPANSFATGTNPEVDSVYLRILAKHPAIKSHITNLSAPTATIDEAARQAAQAAGLKPPPDLVVMQLMDYDLPCPMIKGDDTAYRDALTGALQALKRAAPMTRVFVLSQFGSPPAALRTLTPKERATFGNSMAGWPCAGLDPAGRPEPKGLARFLTAVHGYEAALKTACAEFSTCRYDDGAFGRVIEKREDLADDFVHLTVKGQAKAAAAAWAALQAADLVPAGG